MKSVITASTIFILIIVLVTWSIWYVGDFTDEMKQYVSNYAQYVEDDQWDSAYEEIEKTHRVWGKHREKLAVLLNHSYIDKLDQSVQKLKEGVQLRKKTDCFYEKNNFYLLLENINEQQKISIGNIL